MVKTFSSFKDASLFSRSLAIKNITQQIKRRGNTWEVTYTDGISAEVINDNDLRKLKDLEQENKILKSNIEERAQKLSYEKNVEIDQMLSKLAAEETEIALEYEKEAIKVIEQATNQLEIVEALKSAYSKKFGKAEVDKITKQVTEQKICTNCSGDGGIDGGCPVCHGSGWVSDLTNILVYKAKLFSQNSE
jgi:myo-inositol-1-phosphate synthase